MDQLLVNAVEWSVNLAFWGSLLFPLAIVPVWPWWRDWFGQSMVAFDLCLSGATAGLSLRYDFGLRGTPLAWIDSVSLAMTFVVIMWRTVAIYMTQRKPS
jgi:hypothetical protein